MSELCNQQVNNNNSHDDVNNDRINIKQEQDYGNVISERNSNDHHNYETSLATIQQPDHSNDKLASNNDLILTNNDHNDSNQLSSNNIKQDSASDDIDDSKQDNYGDSNDNTIRQDYNNTGNNSDDNDTTQHKIEHSDNNSYNNSFNDNSGNQEQYNNDNDSYDNSTGNQQQYKETSNNNSDTTHTQQHQQPNKKKRKYARQQITADELSKYRRADNTTDYNIWYNKYQKTGHFDKTSMRATHRVNIELDSGLTMANDNNSYFCIRFATGKCSYGSKCTFLHRIPNQQDNQRIDIMHDCFGRNKFASDRDDMGGIGSFNRDSRTLFVSGIYTNDLIKHNGHNAYKSLYNHFGEFGELEDINVKPKNMCAFVRYKYRLNAEFAKIAMSNQSLDHHEQLNIRWAHDDPNPGAIKRNQRNMLYKAYNAVKAVEQNQQQLLLQSDGNNVQQQLMSPVADITVTQTAQPNQLSDNTQTQNNTTTDQQSSQQYQYVGNNYYYDTINQHYLYYDYNTQKYIIYDPNQHQQQQHDNTASTTQTYQINNDTTHNDNNHNTTTDDNTTQNDTNDPLSAFDALMDRIEGS